MPSDARKEALTILNRLNEGSRTLDWELETAEPELSRLPRRERALFNALLFGVLRFRGRLDFIIGNFSKTPLHRIDSKILNVLRIGTFQILEMDRIPDAAAVHTAVELAKTLGPAWVVRFVNGVLRTVARDSKQVRFPDPVKDAVSALRVEKSFPEWLIRRWVKRYGPAETGALCDAVNTIPPVTVRTNTLQTTREALFETLSARAGRCKKTGCAPDGISLWNLKDRVPDLGAFQSGCFQVQDEAAQLISLLLDPQPGESVLDACAGLGGKTGHLAQLMKNEGSLVAADIDGLKLKRLGVEMRRLGIGCVNTRCLDWEKPDQHLGPFHRVLLDAPCSGLGVLRRNPDTKWSATEADLFKNQQRQIRLLERIADYVKPAGILVYAVCSTEPEETREVVEAFLERRPDFVLDRSAGKVPDTDPPVITPAGHLITHPHVHHMDGFFAVRLGRVL